MNSCCARRGLNILRITCLFSIFISLFAFAKPSKKEQAYDADLFRNQEEVLFTNFEFLYWNILEGSLDYAIKMKQTAFFPTVFASGEMQCADFGWDPGFRVNIGYYNAPKYWEFFVQYTWLKASNKDSLNKPDDANLFLTGTWPHIFLTPVQRAEYKISNLYNTLELLVDRVFHPNPHLRMRILGGLTSAFIGQRWKVLYFDGGTYTSIFNRWRFRGGGLKAGIGLDWFWGGDFYLTAKMSLATLIGRYKNRALQISNTNVVGGLGLPVRDVTLKDIRLAYMGMFSVGPSWQKSFDTARLEVFAGYEFTNWFNLQEVYRSTSGTATAAKETWLNRGFFSLHGLNVRLTIDF